MLVLLKLCQVSIFFRDLDFHTFTFEFPISVVPELITQNKVGHIFLCSSERVQVFISLSQETGNVTMATGGRKCVYEEDDRVDEYLLNQLSKWILHHRLGALVRDLGI